MLSKIVTRIISIFFCVQLWAVNSYAHPDYLRTLNRFASVGTPDAMFFNPAGTVYLLDGMYLQLGIDLALMVRGIEFPGTGEFASTYDLSMPDLSLGFLNKRGNSSFYFTVLPIVSESLRIKNVVLNIPGYPATSTNNRILDTEYEMTFGGAFSLHEVLALSIGAHINSSFLGKAVDYTYMRGGLQDTERYRYMFSSVGFALQAGLLLTPAPWFAIALNMHTGGVSFGREYGKTNANGILYPSLAEGREQSDGFLMKGIPTRFDMGVRIKLDDVAELQLTGQARLDLIEATSTSVKFNINSPQLSYSVGAGIDFKLSKNLLWGFGALYTDDRLNDKDYYTSIEALNNLKVQSVVFGTGFFFNIGNAIDLSISAMYPLYFSTEGGFSFREVHIDGLDMMAEDIVLSIGLTMKVDEFI